MLFQTSACFAAMPISTRSPPPPTRMRGFFTGFGSQKASFTWKCRPSKLVFSCVQRPRQDRERLVERAQPLARLREGQAVALELRGEPAGAEAREGTAARDLVERRDLLREHGGIPEERRRHQRAEQDALGDRGHRGELGPRLEDRKLRRRHAVEVVAHPDRVEAERVEGLRRLARLGPAALDLREG